MIPFSLFLKESRSHETKKSSAWSILKSYYEKDSGNDFFISFTSLPKLGYNPKTIWGTPSGIYAYQLFNSWEEYELGNFDKPLTTAFPFASHNEYMYVFTLTSSCNKLYISNYTNDDFINDTKQLQSITEKYYKLNKNIFNDIVSNAKHNAYKEHPFSYLWNLTRMLSKIVLMDKNLKSEKTYREFDLMKDKSLDNYEHDIPTRSAFIWNWLLRQLKYDVIIDDLAGRFIDTHEKMQSLVLNIKSIDDKFLYDNKYFDRTDEILNYIEQFYEFSERDRDKIVSDSSKFTKLLALPSTDEKQWLDIGFHGEVTIDGELYNFKKKRLIAQSVI